MEKRAISILINYGIDTDTAQQIYNTRFALWNENGRHGKMKITGDDLFYFGGVTPPNGFETIEID